MSEASDFVQRVREYAEKATPADWCIDSRHHPGNAELVEEIYVYQDVDADGTRICTMSFAQGSDAFSNAEFIVSSRTDLPAACDIIERLEAENERLREALEGILPTIEEWAEPQSGYGGFHGGDPRNFHPDAECSTDEERAAHKAACELADAAEAGRELPCPSGWATIGEYRNYINRQPFGLGCYTWEDETMVKFRDAIRAALADTGEGTK